MTDARTIQRIRAIFLHREPRVTIAEAADLLGCSRAEIETAIGEGDIEVVETGDGERIDVRELASAAIERWSLTTIEDALGRDAALILPPALRTRSVTVRLPHYQIGALEILAEDGREPVDAILERIVHQVTDLKRDRLATLIPGFAEAIAWPGTADSDLQK